MTLEEMIESEFDPSDCDRGIRLAYDTLRLMKEVVKAVRDDNNNLRLGRDQKNDMISAVQTAANRLGLLEYRPTAEQVLSFEEQLLIEYRK
jgi:hypothetical protein